MDQEFEVVIRLFCFPVQAIQERRRCCQTNVGIDVDATSGDAERKINDIDDVQKKHRTGDTTR